MKNEEWVKYGVFLNRGGTEDTEVRGVGLITNGRAILFNPPNAGAIFGFDF